MTDEEYHEQQVAAAQAAADACRRKIEKLEAHLAGARAALAAAEAELAHVQATEHTFVEPVAHTRVQL